MQKVRVDKWIWSIRLIKSRSRATRACKDGDVLKDGVKLKPAQTIETGDVIQFRKNGFTYTVKVIQLLEKRVGAAIAATCYEDLTPEEEYLKYESWFNRKKKSEFREKGLGRPTKKDRREIERLKNML
nr:RNA-binding S4 domain-containing protein [Saprospiraceae bacterium]